MTATSLPGGRPLRTATASWRVRSRFSTRTLPEVSRARTTTAGASAASIGPVPRPAWPAASAPRTTLNRICLQDNEYCLPRARERRQTRIGQVWLPRYNVAARATPETMTHGPRPSFRNNARLVLATTVAVLAVFVGFETL